MGVNRANAELGGPKRSAAIQNFGSSKRNDLNQVGPQTTSPKRTTAVDMAGSSRSPKSPTEANRAIGSAKKNGIDGPSPKSSKANGFGRASSGMGPEKASPMGGLPGKGGPNRSAGVKAVKNYIKSEGL